MGCLRCLILLFYFASVTGLPILENTNKVSMKPLIGLNMVQMEGETVSMLDAMMQLMLGQTNSKFDRDFLSELSTCMESLSPELVEVSNGAWLGMVSYHHTDGQGNDTWGSCLGNGHCHQYHEQNLTVQNYHNIGIYEPCNYASNVAYYHVVTSICKYQDSSISSDYTLAMAQAFTALTVGSAFWHGSHTLLGNIADNRFIDVVSFIAHQASLENLPVSSVVRDISLTPRNKTSIETAQQLADMLRTMPVEQWKDEIASLDTPDYMMTFAGIVTTLLTIQLPPDQVDTLIDVLAEAFNLPDDMKLFLLDHYLPEIRLATADVNLGILDNIQLELDTLATLMKLIYAFLWQEYVLTGSDIFLDPEVNVLGAAFMSTVNSLANYLNSFPVLSDPLQSGYGVYPGDTWCNPQEPHSKWHVESANGLMDLMMLADSVFRLTS